MSAPMAPSATIMPARHDIRSQDYHAERARDRHLDLLKRALNATVCLTGKFVIHTATY